MEKKDEKTFADLFSNSASEEDKKNQTFENFFKKENTEVESSKEQSNSPITFDNLFENISNKEDDSKQSPNLFKEAVKEQLQEDTSKNLDSQKILSENKPIENPFFSNQNPSKKEENQGQVQTIIEKNTIEKEEKHLPIFENPFFTDSKNETSTNQTQNIEKMGSQLNSNFQEEENPFFTSSDTQEIKKTLTLKNETKMPSTSTSELPKSEPQKEEIDAEVSKSISPFFEEEPKKEETNPFFQNQINLVENTQPDNLKTNIDISKSKHYDVKIVKKKEPLIKFILGVISYAIFIFLLLIGITLLIYVLDIKIRAAKGDYSTPTFNAYVVLTGSMLPEIQVYDVVITKKVEPANLKEGDIITFASADSRFLGTIITHRIIKKNYDDESKSYNFQTKGDYNNVADSALVPEKNIYGKVILKIPKLGYLQEFLASDGGWIIVILIPCLVVISYDIVKLTKGLKRKKYKNIKVQK